MNPRIRTSFFKAKRRYQVARGSRVRRSSAGWDVMDPSGRVVEHFPAKRPIPAEGNPNWLSFSDLTGSPVPPISRFVSTWTAPPAPADQTLTIYFFNGLEGPGGENILQPVLQWGSTAHGAIPGSWSIASWYVGGAGSPAFSSEAIPVDPGVNLTGVMELDGTTWNCYFDGFPGTSLLVDDIPDMAIAALTLEAYAGEAVPDDVTLDGAPVSFQVTALDVVAGGDLSQCQWSSYGEWPAVVNTSAPQSGKVTIAYR